MSTEKERSRLRRVGSLVVYLVFMLVALVWFGVTVNQLVLPSDWQHATGTLTHSERDDNTGDQLTTYHRSYSFQAGDGRTYTAETERYSEGEQGSTAPVRYDPDDPTRAEVVGFWDRFTRVLKACGLLLLFIGTTLGVVHEVKGLRRHTGVSAPQPPH